MKAKFIPRNPTRVLGAGQSEEWLAGGVAVKGLSTPYGTPGYALAPAPGGYVLKLAAGVTVPSGGVRLAWHGREILLPAAPARVQLVRD